MAKSKTDTRRLIETNLPGYRTFEKPPEGFSPLRATDAELRKHGLPRRPDPERFPREAVQWRHMMASIKKFVTPELTLLPEIVHGLQPLPVFGDQDATSPIWSGLTVQASTGEKWTDIWGTWVVPRVVGKAGDESALWIGLFDSQSLFQAGTDQEVTATAANTYAWFEWFPGPSVQVGLEVLPGDTVTVYVQPTNDGTGSGSISITNRTTGTATAPIVVPPPTTDFNNNPISPPIQDVPNQQAVWTAERPSHVQKGKPVPTPLADFGVSGFLDGAAVDSIGPCDTITYIGENDNGTLLEMLANDNASPLAFALEQPGLIIYFVAAGP